MRINQYYLISTSKKQIYRILATSFDEALVYAKDVICKDCVVIGNEYTKYEDVKNEYPTYTFSHQEMANLGNNDNKITDLIEQVRKIRSVFVNKRKNYETINRFFKPDKEMLLWLKELANERIIVDVGCGKGDLLFDLARVGLTVIGIEPHCDASEIRRKFITEFNEMLHLEKCYVSDSRLLKVLTPDNAIILICRPCHGNFVDEVIRANVNKVPIYYIGLPKNNGVDINYSEHEIISHVGSSEDGEIVVKIKQM